MSDLTTYPGVSDTTEFQAWIKAFKGKSGWIICDNRHKQTVGETLQSIAKTPIKRGSIAMLELNLLYACYMAKHALPPDLDEFAKAREQNNGEEARRQLAKQGASAIFEYIESHRLTALKAMAHAEYPQDAIFHPPTELSSHRLDALTKLLADFEDGLLALSCRTDNPDLFFAADYQYGPFEFFVDVDTKPRGTRLEDLGASIIHAGLMFHLTYLFRYFTCETLPAITGGFRSDVFIPSGVSMLREGTPCGNHVAALTNALFGEKYSTKDIKNRLDALLKPTPGSKSQRKTVLFIGWA